MAAIDARHGTYKPQAQAGSKVSRVTEGPDERDACRIRRYGAQIPMQGAQNHVILEGLVAHRHDLLTILECNGLDALSDMLLARGNQTCGEEGWHATRRKSASVVLAA